MKNAGPRFTTTGSASALGIVLLLGFTAGGARAQPRLDSDPPGVHLRLEGPVSISGVTPLRLGEMPPGRYQLQGQGLGTTWVKGGVTLHLDGRLSAGGEPYGYSLLVPPGLVHLGQKETLRGLFYAAAGIGAISQIILRERDRAGAGDDADLAQIALSEAVSEEAIYRSQAELDAARDEERDAAEMRNLWTAYLGAVWFGAAIETWFLTARPSLEGGPDQGYRLGVPRISGASAALRSALVPGSGQRYAGRTTRANFFLGAVALLGAGSLIAHADYLEASREQAAYQRAYDRAVTVDELERLGGSLLQAAEDAEDANRVRWVFFGSTAGVYLWNVLDAFVLGNGTRRTTDLGFAVSPAAGGFRAGLTWEIP